MARHRLVSLQAGSNLRHDALGRRSSVANMTSSTRATLGTGTYHPFGELEAEVKASIGRRSTGELRVQG